MLGAWYYSSPILGTTTIIDRGELRVSSIDHSLSIDSSTGELELKLPLDLIEIESSDSLEVLLRENTQEVETL